MMAKAHITVGMAAAASIMMPRDIAGALPVIAGASLGCLICDIDCDNKSEKADSARWRKVMAAVALAALIEDHLLDAGIWRSIGQNGSYLWFAGLAGFILTCTFAGLSNHRGFSHSLLALALESLSLWLIFPVLMKPFAIAFISHQILDIMNKKPVRLLYPVRRGSCLDWFYADRLADKLVAAGGSLWLIITAAVCMRG